MIDDKKGGRYYSTHEANAPIPRDEEMEVKFADSDLEKLESGTERIDAYSDALAQSFRKVMRFIRAASDERDFRVMRSMNFEKLKGDRQHQYSFRLNIKWRLVVEIQTANPKKIIVIVAIEDYH